MGEKRELIEPFSPPAITVKAEDRVQVNWQRARKVCQKIRFEYRFCPQNKFRLFLKNFENRFRSILNQRDFNILQGNSLQDIPIKDRIDLKRYSP